MSNLAIVPQAKGASGYVELSKPSTTRSVQGRVFEKQILKTGPLYHPQAPGGKVDVNDAFFDELIGNFDKGACDIVQMTIVDDKNKHTEDPLRNIGEVIGLTKRDGKLFAQVDVRDEAAAGKLGKTLIGASAAMYLDYTDTDTLKKVGPTMTHLAVTNRPYVLGLDAYKEVVELSANGMEADGEAFLLTASDTDSEESNTMTKEEWIEAGKAHGIDVPALQLSAEKGEAAVALSAGIQDALAGTGVLNLSNGEEATADDLITAVAENAKSSITLSARVDTLETETQTSKATARVESLIRAGKIFPKDKAAQVELLLSNETLFESLLPEKPFIALSQSDEDELGLIPLSNSHDTTVMSEVDRIIADAANYGIPVVKAAV